MTPTADETLAETRWPAFAMGPGDESDDLDDLEDEDDDLDDLEDEDDEWDDDEDEDWEDDEDDEDQG